MAAKLPELRLAPAQVALSPSGVLLLLLEDRGNAVERLRALASAQFPAAPAQNHVIIHISLARIVQLPAPLDVPAVVEACARATESVRAVAAGGVAVIQLWLVDSSSVDLTDAQHRRFSERFEMMGRRKLAAKL